MRGSFCANNVPLSVFQASTLCLIISMASGLIKTFSLNIGSMMEMEDHVPITICSRDTERLTQCQEEPTRTFRALDQQESGFDNAIFAATRKW